MAMQRELQMTREELRDEIKNTKLNAFDYMRHLSRLTRSELDHAGQTGRTNAEAVLRHLKQVEAQIEASIRKYEKENP